MEKRIYYHDTDAGGGVYFGHYLKYLEESRTEFLEERGCGVKDFTKQGLFYAVRKCTITYKSPARYGDCLICRAQIKEMTAAQIIFNQTIHDKPSGRVIVEAEVSLVCLTKDFKPTQIPDQLKKKLGRTF